MKSDLLVQNSKIKDNRRNKIMAFCEQCGTRLPDHATECPVCHTPVPAESQMFFQMDPNPPQPVKEESSFQMAPDQPSAKARPAWEETVVAQPDQDAVKQVPNSNIKLAENEEVVRQYQCSNIKRPASCIGYLTVTTKRILFEGRSAGSRISKEVVLDSVSGLDCAYGTNINLRRLILGILVVLVGLTGNFRSMWQIIILLVGVYLIITSFRKTFKLAIYSSKASSSPISIGEGIRSLFGNEAVYTLVSEPTVDTDRMLNELGAMVQDLQTLGDYAVTKWKKL